MVFCPTQPWHRNRHPESGRVLRRAQQPDGSCAACPGTGDRPVESAGLGPSWCAEFPFDEPAQPGRRTVRTEEHRIANQFPDLPDQALSSSGWLEQGHGLDPSPVGELVRPVGDRDLPQGPPPGRRRGQTGRNTMVQRGERIQWMRLAVRVAGGQTQAHGIPEQGARRCDDQIHAPQQSQIRRSGDPPPVGPMGCRTTTYRAMDRPIAHPRRTDGRPSRIQKQIPTA
ncbi:MAG: hypothetical protein RLZZ127_1467 [Planctomycetota bacterium]